MTDALFFILIGAISIVALGAVGVVILAIIVGGRE